MRLNEFNELFQKICEEERQLLDSKGIEYSGEEDRFSNFNRLASGLRIKRKIVLWIYLQKHMDSILSYIITGKTKSNEPIEGRITDARNYLALLRGMIEEEKDPVEKEKTETPF